MLLEDPARTGPASASRRTRSASRRAPRGDRGAGVWWSAWVDRRRSPSGARARPGAPVAGAARGRRPASRPRRRSTICAAARATSARSVSNVSRRWRLGEADPADLLELVVVAGEVAADRLHQEVVDGLVDPRPALDEPVLDRVERAGDPDLEAGLLARPRGSRSARASRRRSACPSAASRSRCRGRAGAQPTTSCGISGLEADDDAAGGSGGRGPQPRHGAVAALERRSVPGAAGTRPAHRDRGPRPAVGRRVADGRRGTARQPPRSRASDAAVRVGGGRSARVVAAWNEPAARRPSRRSRARDDGRTNRAAGRAAYFAAMLSLHGRNGTASDRRCK